MAEDQQNIETQLPNLYKARKTILKMLQDRGYVVSEREANYSYEDWRKIFVSKTESMTFMCCKENDAADNILVIYYDGGALNYEFMAKFYERLKNQSILAGIIITEEPPSPMGKINIQKLNDAFPIQYFELKELIINITEHELVPKHIILDEQEKKDLMKR